ncbi:hypothetical protein BV898_17448 [Hypsibius exemplaris]|uniref:Uncharacterized protein n=1 Tax=Hypsibius exemplaris TaxID=2072580 RepID=A0A9X6NI37_HYPEX|nr:hypothetical protein BV898_17448 [Hypsibius exemplaris]
MTMTQVSVRERSDTQFALEEYLEYSRKVPGAHSTWVGLVAGTSWAPYTLEMTMLEYVSSSVQWKPLREPYLVVSRQFCVSEPYA